MKLQVFASIPGTRPQNPQFRVKLCFLAFLGHSPGGALRAIQSHISIAAIILAFYRVWKNEMGFCNHITVLNTSPQNESTAKQGKRVSFSLLVLTVYVLIYEQQLMCFSCFPPNLQCVTCVIVQHVLGFFSCLFLGQPAFSKSINSNNFYIYYMACMR